MSVIRQRKKRLKEETPSDGERFTAEGSRCTRCKIGCLCSLGLVLIAGVILIAWPSSVEPSDTRFPSYPNFLSMESDSALSNAMHLFENEIAGPEGFAVDKNASKGYIYTGLADGRIIRFKDHINFATVARTGPPPYDGCGSLAEEPRCGRPLGMQLDPQDPSRLYVADAYHGILRLDTHSGKLEVIVDSALPLGNGEPPCKFVNDLVVLDNGSVFFTDTSSKYQRNQVMDEVFDGGGNGRLFHFSLADKSVKVVARGLHFPNGLCLSYDGEFLVLAETTRARILKVPLNGEEAGKLETFTPSLPGLPDNISPSSSGGYWVGIAASRNQGRLDKLFNYRLLRSFMAKLANWVDVGLLLRVESMIVELNKSGEIVRVLRDVSTPLKIESVSEVLDMGTSLYFGSYQAPYIGILHTTHT